MRISLASGAALLLGGLVLATTSLPAGAGEPMQLSAVELDQVTGGFGRLSFAAAGGAFGTQKSTIEVRINATGEGNQNTGSFNGTSYVRASGYGNADAFAMTDAAYDGVGVFKRQDMKMTFGMKGSDHYTEVSITAAALFPVPSISVPMP